MSTRAFRSPTLTLILPCLLACGSFGEDRPDRSDGSDDAAAVVTADERELIAAAERVIGFLRGTHEFDALAVADTVTFHLAPEGGDTRVDVPRERLRSRANWQIRAADGHVYSLVPPRAMEVLTTRANRHFNCTESLLETKFPELARTPHVGTKLEPRQSESCLQTWNLTLVFDRSTPPLLVAAVYDQWEW